MLLYEIQSIIIGDIITYNSKKIKACHCIRLQVKKYNNVVHFWPWYAQYCDGIICAHNYVFKWQFILL